MSGSGDLSIEAAKGSIRRDKGIQEAERLDIPFLSRRALVVRRQFAAAEYPLTIDSFAARKSCLYEPSPGLWPWNRTPSGRILSRLALDLTTSEQRRVQ